MHKQLVPKQNDTEIVPAAVMDPQCNARQRCRKKTATTTGNSSSRHSPPEDCTGYLVLGSVPRQQETIAKWSREKIGDTYIKISNEFQKCSFEKNWTKETAN